jgi:hypothetical protein
MDYLNLDCYSEIVSRIDDVVSKVAFGMVSSSIRRMMASTHAPRLPILSPKYFILICIQCGHLNLLKWFLLEELNDPPRDFYGQFDFARNLSDPLPLTDEKAVFHSIEFNQEHIFKFLIEKYGLNPDELNLRNLSIAFGRAGAPSWLVDIIPNSLAEFVSTDYYKYNFYNELLLRGHVTIIEDNKDWVVFDSTDIDLAIRRGRLNDVGLVFQFLENVYFSEDDMNDFLCAYASLGHWSACKSLIERIGCFTSEARKELIRNGRLEALKSAKSDGIITQFHDGDLHLAFICGHFDVYNYLISEGCKPTLESLQFAVLTGDLDFVHSIHKQIFPGSLHESGYFCAAIKSGNLEIVKSMNSFGISFPDAEREILEAIKTNSIEMVEYIVERCRAASMAFEYIFRPSKISLRMLRYIKSFLNFGLTRDCLFHLFKTYSLEALLTLEELSFEFESMVSPFTYALPIAIELRDLSLVRALVDRGFHFDAKCFANALTCGPKMLECCKSLGMSLPDKALKVAVSNSDSSALLREVRYLVETLGVVPTAEDLIAVPSNEKDVVVYLLAKLKSK